jgi:hypothetical protein
MRCLTERDFLEAFSGARFTIGEQGRLLTNEAIASTQTRIARGGLRDGRTLAGFCRTAIRWLPEGSRRAIAITDAWSGLGDALPALEAIRRGLGEERPLKDVPIHVTDVHSWTLDQLEMTPSQVCEEGLLVGILSLVLSCGWDAWLLADGCSDAIEFWEGNILFYSDRQSQLSKAKALLRVHKAASRMR